MSSGCSCISISVHEPRLRVDLLACVCIYIRAYIHACVHSWVHACLCLHTRVHTCMRSFVSACLRDAFLRMCVCTWAQNDGTDSYSYSCSCSTLCVWKHVYIIFKNLWSVFWIKIKAKEICKKLQEARGGSLFSYYSKCCRKALENIENKLVKTASAHTHKGKDKYAGIVLR